MFMKSWKSTGHQHHLFSLYCCQWKGHQPYLYILSWIWEATVMKTQVSRDNNKQMWGECTTTMAKIKYRKACVYWERKGILFPIIMQYSRFKAVHSSSPCWDMFFHKHSSDAQVTIHTTHIFHLYPQKNANSSILLLGIMQIFHCFLLKVGIITPNFNPIPALSQWGDRIRKNKVVAHNVCTLLGFGDFVILK